MERLHHSIEGLLHSVEGQISSIRDMIEIKRQEMDRLETAGLIYAGTWYKARKYLYLVYPSDGFGERQRKYIGADPTEIQKALDGIQRAAEFDTAKRELQRLNSKLDRITQCLRNAESVADSQW